MKNFSPPAIRSVWAKRTKMKIQRIGNLGGGSEDAEVCHVECSDDPADGQPGQKGRLGEEDAGNAIEDEQHPHQGQKHPRRTAARLQKEKGHHSLSDQDIERCGDARPFNEGAVIESA